MRGSEEQVSVMPCCSSSIAFIVETRRAVRRKLLLLLARSYRQEKQNSEVPTAIWRLPPCNRVQAQQTYLPPLIGHIQDYSTSGGSWPMKTFIPSFARRELRKQSSATIFSRDSGCPIGLMSRGMSAASGLSGQS